jgi:hypothetical protein
MPMTINGFGTSVCGSRGDVGWGSYDGMEWFVALMMPIIPIKCLHTFDWNGEQYRAIPIKWSAELMIRTFLNRWLWGLVIAAVILGIIAFVDKSGFNSLLFVLAVLLVGVAVGIWVTLHVTDMRNKNIRIVLGPITGIGFSDPATFTADMLGGTARILYDTPTFADAAEKLLKRRSYARAMEAARLCVATENRSEGEALTNRILIEPEVIDAIEQVRKKPDRWGELMLSDEDRAAPQPQPEVTTLDEVPDERPASDADRLRREQGEDRPRRRPRDDEDY